MAILGVKLDCDDKAKEYFIDTNIRLLGNDLVKNPFNGKISYDHDFAVIDMKPIYYNFTPYIWVSIVTIYLVWGFTLVLIPLCLLGMAGYFWSKSFFTFILKKGLKKAGYTKQINVLKNNDLLREMIERWDRERSLTTCVSNESYLIDGSHLRKSEK